MIPPSCELGQSLEEAVSCTSPWFCGGSYSILPKVQVSHLDFFKFFLFYFYNLEMGKAPSEQILPPRERGSLGAAPISGNRVELNKCIAHRNVR